MACAQGFVPPEHVAALEQQVARTEADLDKLRRAHPDWHAKIDEAIQAFNESDLTRARTAFIQIDALIAAGRAELAAEAARSKYAQATLFYPFEASRAEPLLCEAAELANSDVWYWVECAHARIVIGNLAAAMVAFEAAHKLAVSGNVESDTRATLEGIGDVRFYQGDLTAALAAYEESLEIRRALAARNPADNAEWARDLSIGLHKVGDVRFDQGDLTAALAAYEESLEILRALAARDPGNATWARDVSIGLSRIGDVRSAQGDLTAALAAYEESLETRRALAARDPDNATWARDLWLLFWRLALTDPENAKAHWAAAVRRMENMEERGTLLSTDRYYLDEARQNLATANAAQPN